MSNPLEELPWFSFYRGDYLRVTAGWPVSARTLYIELLAAQWDNGKLPDDPARLQALARLSTKEWKEAWPYVEAAFPSENGSRQNYVLEVRRGEALAVRASRRRGASITNSKRWNKTPERG